VTKLLFYVFAIVLVVAALRVITARNPVHSALSLVLAFVASSGLWLLIETEFLAVVLVLVYVGAVMVLFLFVVMMLDINLVPLREGFIRYLPVGALVALLIVVQLAMVVGPGTFGIEQVPRPAPLPADYSNTEALGVLLYTVYVYPFELAAVILLVAIVAAIALTMRRRAGLRSQPPHEQVRVRREDRVRLVKMPAESEK
jgi:NADH-quinone oxidoreductase subunit J